MVSVFENEKYGYEQIGRYINSKIPSKYLYDSGNRKMYALTREAEQRQRNTLAKYLYLLKQRAR